jgi:hypothetical protein
MMFALYVTQLGPTGKLYKRQLREEYLAAKA